MTIDSKIMTDNMPQWAQERIYKAREQTPVTLDLRPPSWPIEMEKLTFVPLEILELAELQNLSLSDNNIESIPDTISCLKNLRTLDLANNLLTTVPATLAQIDRLQELYLSDNQLTKIPDVLGCLNNLQRLHRPFHRLNYDKLIPCNCTLCCQSAVPYFYRMDSLKRRIANNKHQVECDYSFKTVDVWSLIDDISTQERLQDWDEPLALPDLRKLLYQLEMTFDDEEVKTLCFELGVNYHDLPAQGRNNRIRELITYLQRHGRLKELIELVERT